MTTTLVITGVNGFVGTHLAALARTAGHRVIGIGRESGTSVRLAASLDQYLTADLYETWPVTEPVDAIVHLAGLAAVGPSFREPQRYIEVNSGIMTRMCEPLLARGQAPRIVVVSSGAVYAPPADTTPVSEDCPLSFNSPYAVAKLLVESQARYYAARGLDIVIARPFNHIGPGQGPGFIVPDLTAALRNLPAGQPLTVGNLNTARDYTDVRDVATAYLTLAFAPKHEQIVYNIATGRPHTGREVLAAITDALTIAAPTTTVDETRLRPNDPGTVIGDSTRIRAEHGWAPAVAWDRSIAEYVSQARAAELESGL